ncbi:hypothetical protein FB639_003318, partial [Coemansia asiatica]
AWSDIDDNSATEDEDTVLKRKRILRHGRKRLSEMRERFNAAKTRLFEARKQQLDLEMSQLKNGTHPQYKEFVEQVDARWTDRLEKIRQKMEFNRDLARLKLESSQRAATNTFIASRSELRRAMILRRKKQMWALADDLRNLDRIREAVIGIACPLSNIAGPLEPVKGSAAPAYSSHLLSLPDTHLAKADEDADVSAICGIPALLNYSESDIVDTEDSSQTLITVATDGIDIQVPVTLQGYAHEGAEESVAIANSDMAGSTAMANAASASANTGYESVSASQDYQQQAYAGHMVTSDASHMVYNAPMSHHQDSATVSASVSANYYSSSSVAAENFGGPYEKHDYGKSDHLPSSSSNTKITDLVHNAAAAEPAASAAAATYTYGGSRKQQQQQHVHMHANGHIEDHRMSGYYDGVNGTVSGVVRSSNGLKRDMTTVDYDGSVSGKRQRVAVQPSAAWTESSQYQQQQQYPSYQGAQEWQEAPVSATASLGKHRYHPADAADPAAMTSYAYSGHDYYHKYHQSQYSPPLAAEQPQLQQQPYHYSQQQQQQQKQQPQQQQRQDYHRQGISSSAYYGGSQKYEYAQEPSVYYQQQAHLYHGQDNNGYYQQGSTHYAHPHSGSASAATVTATASATASVRQPDGYYQSSSHPQYGQQQQQMAGSYAGQVPNDYHQQQQQQRPYASNSSYSGLDTGISMPAPSNSSAWGDYYSQQQQQQRQHYQGSQGYRQQQQHAYDSRGRN